MSEKQSFWNNTVGGLSIGITLLVLYIGFKYTNVGLSSGFFWYCFWFTGIIINALMTDLFQNTGTWIFNSMQEIERKDIPDVMKFKILKEQLQIAIDRYDTVFFMVNKQKIGTILGRILKGNIMVKELIIIFLYAVYDLVLKNGYLSMTDPYDILILFGTLIGLKIIDARSGFASLVAEMYQKSFNEKYTSTTLETMKGYIKQLCHIFHIEYEEEVLEKLI